MLQQGGCASYPIPLAISMYSLIHHWSCWLMHHTHGVWEGLLAKCRTALAPLVCCSTAHVPDCISVVYRLQGCYFLGKALWDKGHGDLMDLLQHHGKKHGQVQLTADELGLRCTTTQHTNRVPASTEVSILHILLFLIQLSIHRRCLAC